MAHGGLSTKLAIGLAVAGGLGFAALALWRKYKTQQYQEWANRKPAQTIAIPVANISAKRRRA